MLQHPDHCSGTPLNPFWFFSVCLVPGIPGLETVVCISLVHVHGRTCPHYTSVLRGSWCVPRTVSAGNGQWDLSKHAQLVQWDWVFTRAEHTDLHTPSVEGWSLVRTTDNGPYSSWFDGWPKFVWDSKAVEQVSDVQHECPGASCLATRALQQPSRLPGAQGRTGHLLAGSLKPGPDGPVCLVVLPR